MFQHTAARRRLLDTVDLAFLLQIVSTHSRAKAAAFGRARMPNYRWLVSTHSRAKAAANGNSELSIELNVSTHSRAKAAAFFIKILKFKLEVSTHSRAKAAAHKTHAPYLQRKCFNTQPREGGCSLCVFYPSHT